MSRLTGPGRILIVFLAAICGCGSHAAAPRPSIGGELKRQDDQLVGQRFRTLLDFESDSDMVFIKSDGNAYRADHGHTGASSLFAEQGVTIKVDSLLYGAKLPQEWTLLGAYVRPTADQDVTAELLLDGQPAAEFSRQVAGGAWAFVGIDLTPPDLARKLRSATRVALHLSALQADYDDALLVNNTRTLIDTSGSALPWTITQRGGEVRVLVNSRETLIPLVGAAAGGWSIDEISALRLCLRNGKAGESTWTILADGRSIRGGKVVVIGLDGDVAKAAALRSTAEERALIEVDDAGGRIDRDTPGDANNDGYNERLGAYEIRATGARLALKIAPAAAAGGAASPPMTQSPVLEISDLPPGQLQVTMEGKLIDTAARLPDGRVLILLPIAIDRPTEVTVRASDKS